MPNVYLTTWAPQASIIAHPNLKLFIAHGGYNSLLEAARFGVPMLLIPLANDGYSNSRLVERNQWGLYFEKTHLLHSHTELQSAIQKMLNDPRYISFLLSSSNSFNGCSYKERALRTQQLFINKPMSAEQKLTKYVRLLEMSGELPELQSIARKLSFIELYNLDVFFILFLLFLFIIYCSFRVLKCLLSMTFGHKLKSE
jgi:glucuronosyltransferase